MNYLLIALSSFWVTTSAFAVTCPMPHPKYLDMLARLDAFTQSIKKGPECTNLVDQLGDLKQFYSTSDRDLVEKAIQTKQKREELSSEELVRLQAYTESATQKIGGIVSALTQKKGCTQGRPVSSLQAIAGMTMELSSLSAAFTGPYGVVIQAGGAAISGILQGIDSYMKSQKDPYDFKRSEDRMLFVTQLCSYDSIREEVITMVEMNSLVNTYQSLVSELAIKKQKLVAAHTLAAQYETILGLESDNEAAPTDLNRALETVRAMPATETPWARCLALSKVVYPAPMAVADRVTNVLQNPLLREYENRNQVPAAELLALARNGSGVPTLSACLSERDGAVLEARNRWSMSLLTELGKTYDQAFADAKRGLLMAGERDRDGFGYNSVQEYREATNHLKWAQGELPKLQAMSDSGSYTVRRELSDRRMYLDQRLFTQLAPRFITWYINDSRQEYARFSGNSDRLLRELYHRYSVPKTAGDVSWNSFLTFAKKIEDSHTHSSIYYDLDIFTEDLLQSVTSYHVSQTYCNYVTGRGTMSNELERACNSREFTDYRTKVKGLEAMLVDLSGYFSWVHEKGYVDRISVSALLEKIKKMHERIGVPIKKP